MKTKLVFNSSIPKIGKADAITIYPFLFFVYTKEYALTTRVIHHEYVHVRQVRKLGWSKFYWSYLVEYIKLRLSGQTHGEAYVNLSFEKEAYAAQDTLELTEEELKEIS